MGHETQIEPDQLASFARCRFVHRMFASYPCLRSLEPMDDKGHRLWKPYRGKPFDPEKFELIAGGWDHEHCDVCWATVRDGDWYWPNEDENAGHVDLCVACYPRVMRLLGRS